MIFTLLFVSFLFLSKLNLEDLNKETVKSLANDNLILIFLILFLLNFLQNSFSVLPKFLIISLSVSLFGPFIGSFLNIFFSFSSSLIVFFFFKYFFKNEHESEKIKNFSKKIEKNAFAAILLAKIIPIFPSSIINIGCGISNLKTRIFLFSNLLGEAIYTFSLLLIIYFVR